MRQQEFDVVIIGGGATGCHILRDCALRGLSALLLERDDLAAGTTGRNHGLLHSGARYAVTDGESAKECIQENRILKRIARHCIEETDGLFITLPEDDLAFQDTFLRACADADINAERIDPNEAKRLEPNVNPNLIGAIKVPDGSLDPFRFCSAALLDAKEHGAQVRTHTELVGFLRNQTRVTGVRVFDHLSQTFEEIHAREVINAAGIWGQKLLSMADITLNMFPAKGSLLILEHRINNLVINRCRKPADADILVPGDSISLIGTTSEHIDYRDIDKLRISANEVDTLIHEGAKLAPILAHSRLLRAYAGVRPLVALGEDTSGRNLSRGIVLLDHAERDGLEGLTTITGGKLMTARLMAEWATDLVAKKLGNTALCETHQRPLPGSEPNPLSIRQDGRSPIYQSAYYRHGARTEHIFPEEKTQAAPLICECEMVTQNEVHYATQALNVNNLVDLRRRTRVGMGSCQGELCAYRAIGALQQSLQLSDQESVDRLNEFLEERWKGIRPILWGDAMRETELTYWLYQQLLGLAPQEEQANEI